MEKQKTKTMPDESSGALRRRFIEPPFSVLDAKTGVWKERKNKWTYFFIYFFNFLNIFLRDDVGKLNFSLFHLF